MKRCILHALLMIAAVAAITPAVAAELVQLVAPSTMTLTLCPGQSRALVRETRDVALPAGESTLNFSWAASAVDPASATLTVEGATVGDAIRAAGQDKALGWRISAPEAVAGKATLTYFLEGLKWYPSYRLWLADDGTARLAAYLHLSNESGLDLPELQVQVSTLGPGMIDQLGGEGTEPAAAATYAVTEPIALGNGQTVVRQLLEVPALPAVTHYLYQAERFNGAVERLLVLSLPEGLAGLPEGAMTIYTAEPDGLPIFNTRLSYQAGQEVRVSLGPEQDLVVERRLTNTSRANFETDRFGRVTGSDTSEEYALSIRNRLQCPVTLEVTETVLSTWELKNAPTPTLTDTSSVQFDLPLEADQEAELKFLLLKHSGSRVKR